MTLDTRVIEIKELLAAYRFDDAIVLMEELRDELPAPQVVWCPNDARETARDASGHETKRGLVVVK